MLYQAIKNYLPTSDLRQQQTNNIVLITFWSQFSVYALNTVLILFLTRPLIEHGLGYNQAKAYAFIGVTQATSYLMPVLGGFMADQILGLRRAILLGSIMLALAYLFVMLSGYTLTGLGDKLFIAAYALIPATNSLLMGTASGLVSHIYSDDAIKAKSAMTYYYMAINVGALLATFIAPILMDSPYGPLSILALAFMGKSLAALNFAKRYALYNNVVYGRDKKPMSSKAKLQLFIYIIGIYTFTLLAYSQVYLASIIIGLGCVVGIFAFLIKTIRLPKQARLKQLVALILVLEAIIFFIIYNQMNSTLILFAEHNSDLKLLNFHVSPAHYQLLNPLLIIILGLQLPQFYRRFPKFTIPYQFAMGTILAGLALLIMAFASITAQNGYVNGNYIGLTYILITLAELWVSAIGLSMIGLYCDSQNLGFAMGVWYLACSLSNTISGRLASIVAIPEKASSTVAALPIYTHYYFWLGCLALISGTLMSFGAYIMQNKFKRAKIAIF
ncbi:IraAB [Legionella busanensis]|uniref:IraAB n=1 Tax=Legionella busanensis TaxID=190655 RepID=A0A378JIR6_9GAMM|nr:oligopeptide:H+ symporter [Legionella busanensis]STX51196.1 IraAB [Legionella busanensis]